MMRRAGLLALLALWFAASSLAAGPPATASPRISAEQAKQKAAAFARTVGLPWEEGATATLSHIGDIKDQTGPALWQVNCGDAGITLRSDTGAVLSFGCHEVASSDQGKQPPTEEEAVAAATRALRLLHAAPTARPDRTSWSRGGWQLSWKRRTPGGIPYYPDQTSATVDAAGRVVGAGVFWPSRPPANTKARISKRRAAALALEAARDSGQLGAGRRKLKAELQVVHPSDFGRTYTSYFDVPSRLAWTVAIIRPAARSQHVVAVDAIDGKVLGSYSSLWRPPSTRRGPGAGLTAWVATGALAAGFAAAVAYLARRREEKPVEEQEV